MSSGSGSFKNTQETFNLLSKFINMKELPAIIFLWEFRKIKSYFARYENITPKIHISLTLTQIKADTWHCLKSFIKQANLF
jgi:hypothetical protein